jgi:cyclase
MLKKRIIFTLIYSDGFFTQSRNFRLQKVGNLKWLQKNYNFSEIAFNLDELVILNASREEKNLSLFSSTIRELVKDVFIPISAGGGINTLEDADFLFKNGADKIVINTSLNNNPSLVSNLVKKYGSQSIVASIDYKLVEGKYLVYVQNGTIQLDCELAEYLQQVQSMHVGEIYLNSIDKDGTGFNYDFETINQITHLVNVPLIIAGGAGNEFHLIEGLRHNKVNAVATANLFNFIGDGIKNARIKILESGIPVSK